MNLKVLPGITRPLASVTELVKNGCQVVFDHEANSGSYLLNRKTGEYHKLFPSHCVLFLPVWVKLIGGDDSDEEEGA